jgi:hypothetical protein
MKFLQYCSIFIIVLVISLNFTPNYLRAEELNSTGNSTNNNSNLLEVNLTGNIPTLDVPYANLGDDNIKGPWMEKPVYKNPEWKPPNVRKKHWYNIIGWLIDCIKYVLYIILYALKVILNAIWFTLQMVVWFFVCVTWVPYAIVMAIAHAKDFGQGFALIFWCFSSDGKFIDKNVTRSIYIDNLNNTNSSNNNSINNTNNTIKDKLNMILENLTNTTFLNCNNTTLINCNNSFISECNNITLINCTNVTNSTNVLNTTIVGNNSFNLTDYLFKNHLSSNSGNIYENVTNNNLTSSLNDINKSDKDIKFTLLFINTFFEGINNVLTLISLVCNIVSLVAAALAVPTEGTSVPQAAGAQVARIGAEDIIGEIFKKIFQGIILEGATTALCSIKDKYQGKAGSRAFIMIKRIDDCIKAIGKAKADSSAKNIFSGIAAVFGIIRDIMGMLCTIAEMFWVDAMDEHTQDLKQEIDYRNNNHLVVN